jgi:hypothetical protein
LITLKAKMLITMSIPYAHSVRMGVNYMIGLYEHRLDEFSMWEQHRDGRSETHIKGCCSECKDFAVELVITERDVEDKGMGKCIQNQLEELLAGSPKCQTWLNARLVRGVGLDEVWGLGGL